MKCPKCGGIKRPAVAALGLCYCDEFDDDELGIDPEEEADYE